MTCSAARLPWTVIPWSLGRPAQTIRKKVGIPAQHTSTTERMRPGWSRPAYPSQREAADDFFGRSIAIHGEVIAVGAFGYDEPETGVNAGAVYFFRRQGGHWFFEEQLTSADPAPKAQFGFSLDLVGDAAEPTWLVVGANQYASEPIDPLYESPPGRVELFRRHDRSWQPATRLDPQEPEEGQAGTLGASVAMGMLEQGNSCW